jgi:hypothetical protein
MVNCLSGDCYHILQAAQQVYICYYDGQRRNLTVTAVELHTATAATATATASTAASTATAAASASSAVESQSSDTPGSGRASSTQYHLELGEYIQQCLGIGTPQDGGLLLFGKVSCSSVAALQYCEPLSILALLS